MKKGQYQHQYTAAQLAWLRANVPGRPWREVSDLFNHHFGLAIKWPSVWAVCKRRGISNGRDSRFVPGQEPWNKGVPGSTGWSPTRFQPGSRPHNHVPVGTERDNEGYIEVKVAEPHVWCSKARLEWEAHHGRPVPDKHVVKFLDGDRRNFSPDNLVLIERAHLAVANKCGLVFAGQPELTRVGLTLAKVSVAKNAARRKLGKRRAA